MPDVSLALAMNLTPERAVEYFEAKGLRITSNWRSIEPRAHAGAFTVAGVLKGEVLQDIRDALQESLEAGVPYQDFVKGLMPKLKAKGWWGVAHDPETGEVMPGRAMTPYRLRTVYQTNMQSAYMAGRYKAQLENAEARPYWQYVAVLDNRTRPRHRSLNGRIFRYDDPAWSALYPPNGYNCRCRVKALSATDMQAEDGALSQGEGHMETIEADLGPRGGKMPVTGYRDPATKELFAPDPGFDTNPGQSAYGTDIALARRVQSLKSREIRTQVWQELNNSPKRLGVYHDWLNDVLDSGRPGHGAQVVGFIDESVADFMTRTAPDNPPVRVAAINEKRLVHADSAKHQDGGIALNRDQYMMLPGIVAKPDAVYYDSVHQNFAFVRELADGGAIYMALDQADAMAKVGEIDAIVNAYRLAPGAGGVGRLANAKRFVKMNR